MAFNLLNESWISVKRADSSGGSIAPWMITDPNPAPVSGFSYSRPDFGAAMVQFLIGLLQTLFMPRTDKEWRQFFSNPPAPELLKERFSVAEQAFNLLGNGPRFMQDQSLRLDPLDPIPVANLLIDSPGENTLKENKAFFNKGSGYSELAYAEAALALFCLQTNAPAGGQGHRTSLRGGGPLTTLVWSGKSLWENLWLNVLPEPEFFRGFTPDKNAMADRFPWMGKVRTSEAKGGSQTFPEDAHPAQYYWAMPRRIWLLENPDSIKDGKVSGRIASYKTKNYGVQYAGSWQHPLSPYQVSNEGTVCLHPQPGGIGYRHWMGLVVPGQIGKKMVLPAKVVQYLNAKDRSKSESQYRLWAFGYDVDKGNIRCWYEGMLPLLNIENAFRPEIELKLEDMIKVADAIAHHTQRAVQKAWLDEYREVRGNLDYVQALFWGRTEAVFYEHLGHMLDALKNGSAMLEILASWLKDLKSESEKIFDQYALSSPLEYEDPKRIVLARLELIYRNGDAKIKGLLGLPVEKPAKDPKAIRKSKGSKDVAVV